MASKTTYWDLTKLDSGEDVHTDGFASTDRDVMDQALKVGVHHHHTGALFAAPTETMDFSPGVGGTLPPGVEISYTYTWVHPELGESTPAPLINVVFSGPIPPPAAPTYTVQSVGGFLPPGTYFYVLSAYQGTTLVETTAANPVEVVIPAGTTTNQVTLTPPAIPSGATGFNVYRRGPNDSRYHFIGSTSAATFIDQGSEDIPAENLDLNTIITTEAGSTLISDPGMQTRSLPATNTTDQDNASNLIIDPIPAGYTWNIYRRIAGTYERIAADLDDAVVDWFDDGSAGTAVSPPTAFIGNSPEKVLLTDGAEVQGLLPGEMVAIDDSAYTTISGDTLDIVLNGIDAALGPGRQGLTIGPVGSGAHFECDGTNDEVQFQEAITLAVTESYGSVFVMQGGYNFHATCTVDIDNFPLVLKTASEGMYHSGSYEYNSVWITHYNPTQPMFTVSGDLFAIQSIDLALGGTADVTNVSTTASLIDASDCGTLVLEGCRLWGPMWATAVAPAILSSYTALRIADCRFQSANNRSFVKVTDSYVFGTVVRNAVYVDWDGAGTQSNFAIFDFSPGGTTSDEEMYFDISNNFVEWTEIPFLIAREKTSDLLIYDNHFPWSMGFDWHLIQLSNTARVEISDNKIAGSISITDSQDIRIMSNSFHEAGLEAVLLTNATNCQVQDNNIRDAGTFTPSPGIRVEGTSSGNVLAGNIFRGYESPATMTAAILIDTGVTDTELLQNSFGGFGLVDNGTDTSFGPIGYHAIVDHGATASTPRPVVFGPVLWRGSVEPTNAIAGDDWSDESVGSGGSIDGGSL